VPAPPDATVEVGSAASVVGGAESYAGVAGPAAAEDGLDDGDPVGVAAADPLGFVEGVAQPPADVVALGVLRGVLALARGVLVVARGEADVVRGLVAGVDVGAFPVGVGADVAGADGGAMPGCWPEPKRKPMTLPPGGE
jgi:hypothetical protein